MSSSDNSLAWYASAKCTPSSLLQNLIVNFFPVYNEWSPCRHVVILVLYSGLNTMVLASFWMNVLLHVDGVINIRRQHAFRVFNSSLLPSTKGTDWMTDWMLAACLCWHPMRVVRCSGVVVVHIVYKINIIHLTVILLEQNNDHYLILCSGRETTKQNI